MENNHYQDPEITLELSGIEPEPVDLAAVEPKKEIIPEKLDESRFTPEEVRKINEFASKIDIANSNLILQYGSGAQKKMAEFSEAALSNVRTKDLGEVGEMISSLIGELKGFDSSDEKKGLFRKARDKIEVLKTRYAKAEVNVEKISTILENHQVQLLKDVAMLDQMYERNLVNYKELSMYILAGRKKLEEVRATVLPQMIEKARQTGQPEDSQAANDMAGFCNRFEKKLHDLDLTRMVSIQMSPQIRLVQNNNTMMSEKIQTTLHNTIPLWKSQMVLALGIAHSTQAMQAQREVSNMTNELLRKNAETLKMGTIETAKESERGIVDIETLQHTNKMLIETLDEVMKIQVEGHQKRRLAEAELGRIEGELKQKLLEIRN